MPTEEKRKLWLFFIPSSVAAFISIASPTIPHLLLHFVAGCFAGFAAYKTTPSFRKIANKASSAIIIGLTLVVSFHVCQSSAKSFFLTWSTSSTLSLLFSMLFPTPMTGIIVASVLVGVLGFPFIAFVIYNLFTQLFLLIDSVPIHGIIKTLISQFHVTFNIKTSIRIFANLITAVLLGIGLLYAAYTVPLDAINQNVRDSANLIHSEGTYPTLYSWATSRLDNYTDSLMLLEAADNTNATTLQRIINVYRGSIDNLDPAATLFEHYINNQEFDSKTEYARYWHGYLVVLKPLLRFLNYSDIRKLNALVQTACIFLVSLLLLQKKLKEFIFPFIVSFAMLTPSIMAKSMQYSSCFYITILGMIALLLIPIHKRSGVVFFVFFNIGILTAYFDFLTYPITTFGIPAILYLVLHSSDELKQRLVGIIINGIFWAAGYIGMWVSKWLVVQALTESDFLASVFSQIAFRINGSVNFVSTSLDDVLISNYTAFFTTPVTLIVIILFAVLIIRIKRSHILNASAIVDTLLPYVVIGIIPVAWYTFAKNHSAIHFWFTNKSCIVTVMALLFALSDVVRQNKQG